MNEAEPRLEELAEAIVFAHELDTAELPKAPTGVAASLERTAALAAAAMVGGVAAPPAMYQRLAAAGLSFCAEQRPVATPRLVPRDIQAGPRRPSVVWPFLVGVAAGLALLFVLPPRIAGQDGLAASDRLANLLRADHDTTRLGWRAGPSPLHGQVVGEVVWSQSRQEGYLTFKGLPPLGPDRRFQLWIVDGTREGDPVDGGLFAIVDQAAETVVPVRTQLPIGKPAAFVVTVEPKAGVVVSKQEHVVAIAAL